MCILFRIWTIDWNTERSDLNGSKHSLNLIWYKNYRECNFGLLRSFPDIWIAIFSEGIWLSLWYDFVILATGHEHIVARFPRQTDMHAKIEVVLENGFYCSPCRKVIRWTTGARKGSALQIGYQETSSKDTAGWKTYNALYWFINYGNQKYCYSYL
jgi:hypothetical protein